MADTSPRNSHSFSAAPLQITREETGVVIPVFFPEGADNSLGHRLLEDTVTSYTAQLSDPASLCLSVDGRRNGLEIAEQLAGRFQTLVCCAAENRGKLQGVRNGMARLLESANLSYFVVVDSDGDHFANELINLARAALHFHSQGVDDVLVLGERNSKHRPMGFLRGELEELADRTLLDMLAYHAAIEGRPLHLEGATTFGEYPDFHSGFKPYSRAAASATFMEEPRLCGASEDAYYKHGCESVMTVEPLLAGARLVLAKRSTFNEQPVSTFGLLDRDRMVADKIIWPAKRLNIPPAFLDQWLRNHMPRLLLNTLAPQGQEELLQIRRLILDEFGGGDQLRDDLVRPLFL